ncbi:MAG: hypothetical protein ABIM43_05115 [candidate division WOR-3 bacterium]
MSKDDVLLIAYYFSFPSSIGGLRPLRWAKYLSKRTNITVVTLKKQGNYVPKQSLENTRVLEVENQFVKLIKSMLKQGTDDNSVNLNNKKDKNLFDKMKYYFNKLGIITWDARMPNLADFWFFPAYSTLKGHHYKAVISSYAPYVSHIIAYKLKKNGYADIWVADFRDLWSDNQRFSGIFPFNCVEKLLEKHIIKYADIITTVSEPLANLLKSKYPQKNVQVIENGFDVEELNQINPNPYWQDSKVRFVYTGSVYEDQHLETFFEALKRIFYSENAHLLENFESVFFVSWGQETLNKKISPKYKEISKYIKIANPIKREDALRVQRDAHALLFFEYEVPLKEGMLSGKIYEYLFSKTIILGIGVEKVSAKGKMLEESRCGIAFGKDADLLANYILEILKTAKKPEIKPDYEYLKKFTSEHQTEKLLHLIEAVYEWSKTKHK